MDAPVYHWARVLAAAQVSLILWGWALAQFPAIAGPHYTIFNCAAPEVTLRLMLIALACSVCVLIPSLYCLYRVFATGEEEAAT